MKKSSPSFRKVERPKICKPAKKVRKKAHALAQAWASAKKPVYQPELREIDYSDEIPMRHMRSGRPLGHHCTCKVAPAKYCWKCKLWAARPDIMSVADIEADLLADIDGSDLW